MKYRFYRKADADQDSIWRYTRESWGEIQAEKYITELHAHLERLANNQNLWLNLPHQFVVPLDLDRQIYFSNYEHHYVFFRVLSEDVIGVVSILHEKMDLPVRLNQDLKKLIALKD